MAAPVAGTGGVQTPPSWRACLLAAASPSQRRTLLCTPRPAVAATQNTANDDLSTYSNYGATKVLVFFRRQAGVPPDLPRASPHSPSN